MNSSSNSKRNLYEAGIEDIAPHILETLGFGVMLVDTHTQTIAYANSTLLSMSGHNRDSIIGSPCHKIICPKSHNAHEMLFAEGGSMPVVKKSVPLTLNGRAYMVESIMDNSKGKTMEEKIAAANENLRLEIEEHQKAKIRLQHMACHDYLTGLPNRMMFSEKLDKAISHADSSKSMLAIMFMDMDGFKMINDTMGHAAGDRLLSAVSERLLKILGDDVSIARIGGDEFLVLIENSASVEEISEAAAKILGSFSEHFIIDGQDFSATASIGISVYPADGKDAEVLIKNADSAMYKAKEKGRNQYVLCNTVIKEDLKETVMLSSHLQRALERDEFRIYYQPQVNCITNEIIGAEALLRWKNPQLGVISPAKFIPIAEQTGLIVSIGEWVIRNACNQNKAWQDAGLPAVKVAVNLSVRQFQNQNIIKQVSDILEESGMDPKYLELEITESIAMKETGYVIEILNAFKAMGVDISIDDFGTEYSCLKYLKQLPVDRIKIAMPFIQGIDVSDKDEAIAKAIIVLAKSMKLRVIAEGVETKSQLSFLSGNMCDEVQGYYYYKPMTAGEFEELMKAQMV